MHFYNFFTGMVCVTVFCHNLRQDALRGYYNSFNIFLKLSLIPIGTYYSFKAGEFDKSVQLLHQFYE